MMHDLLALVVLVASGACLSVLLSLIFLETRRTRTLDRRLAVPRGQAAVVKPRTTNRQNGGLSSSLRAGGLALLRAGSMLVPVGPAEREKLSTVLRHAGFEHRDALSLFLSAKLIAAVACGFGAASAEILGPHGLLVALSAAGGLVIGGIVPEYVVRMLGARRARQMAASLPDALDLLVMCLEAGLTFERALATVASELMSIEPNLAGEFRLMEAELRLGSNRREVLQDFQHRTGIEGMRDLARTLMQSERYGTPLTQSMRNIADGERLQRATRIMEQAERLPVLMTLPMILFVVPGTVLLVAGPAFLTAIDALDAIGKTGG